jgi:NAD(P)-dependent dehydrogenase (short-subunit alcohol dehydrogenase family)
VAKTWFVTGATRGIGAALVAAAVASGDNVVATGRVAPAAIDGDPSVLRLTLDVTDPASITAAVHRALDTFGAIDVLVNNAGRGLVGAVEEVSDAEARALFDVNVFGLLSVTRAILPAMRQRRTGWIVNVGSVGGFATSAGWGAYGASKFAVEGLTEALHAELAALGISVTVIELGVINTDFLDSSSLVSAAHLIGEYADTVGVTRTWAEQNNHRQTGDPAVVAAALVELSSLDSRPLRVQVGADAIRRVQAKLDFVTAEMASWRYLGDATTPTGGASA